MIDKSKALKSLGEQIKSIREKKGISQSELAKLSDKERQSIHRLEKGLINPSYLYLLEISKSIDVPLTELLNIPPHE